MPPGRGQDAAAVQEADVLAVQGHPHELQDEPAAQTRRGAQQGKVRQQDPFGPCVLALTDFCFFFSWRNRGGIRFGGGVYMAPSSNKYVRPPFRAFRARAYEFAPGFELLEHTNTRSTWTGTGRA